MDLFGDRAGAVKPPQRGFERSRETIRLDD